MTSRFAQKFLVALLLAFSGWAAAYAPVNVFTAPTSVPDTGYSATVMGPCYCDQTGVFSPVVVLPRGTYDLGTVRDFWVPSGFTPDGGPDQPVVWLLFAPWQTAGTWPYDLEAPPTYAYPTIELCALDDDACNAHYDGAYLDTRLIAAVGPDQDAIQVGFIGPYAYTPPSPLPEPLPCALFVMGLALVAGMARRRGRQAIGNEPK